MEELTQMAYKKIKLVVTDLDGTLLNSRKEVPAGFEDWVCELSLIHI